MAKAVSTTEAKNKLTALIAWVRDNQDEVIVESAARKHLMTLWTTPRKRGTALPYCSGSMAGDGRCAPRRLRVCRRVPEQHAPVGLYSQAATSVDATGTGWSAT